MAPISTEDQPALEYDPSFNLYKDSCIREAVLVVGPLTAFMLRVKQLLDQWPENVTLQQLIKIADRILSFSPESSLIKVSVLTYSFGLTLLFHLDLDWS